MVTYATEKWSSAKAEFLAALEAATNARESASAKIAHDCGQSLEQGGYNLIPFGIKFETTNASKINYCGYDTQATINGIWEPPVANHHWSATLTQIKAETKHLQNWGNPEQWEAAWAKAQE